MSDGYKIGSNTVIDTSDNIYLRNLYYNNLMFDGFQGVNFGFDMGGTSPSYTSTIRRFPFATDYADASDISNLSATRRMMSGQSSSTHGYSSGGSPSAPGAVNNIIERFPFSSAVADGVTDVGDLTVSREALSGQSSDSYGYASGGSVPPATNYNVIDRFPFSDATTNASDVGDLSVARNRTAGQSSDAYGYISGGLVFPTSVPGTRDRIDRFPFALASTDSTDVGDLTVTRYLVSGQSSTTHGYSSGGVLFPGVNRNQIDRFPFSSGTVNATDVGDLLISMYSSAGVSSLDNGYTVGGFTSPGTYRSRMEKFPFAATITNATFIGVAETTHEAAAGVQY